MSSRCSTVVYLPIVATALAILVVPLSAWGMVTVSLADPVTSAHELQVAPGGTFAANVWLQVTDSQMYSVQYTLRANTANTFAVIASAMYYPWEWWDSGLGPLNPDSAPMGATIRSPQYFGPGTAAVTSLVFSVDPEAGPGLYQIAPIDIWYSPHRMLPYIVEGQGESLLVQIVPEPATLFALLAGSILFLRRRPW